MRKILRTLLAIVGVLVIAAFAVANREAVEVSFWPLPLVRTAPLYAVLLIGVVIGVVLGSVATWLSAHRRRVAYRSLRERVTGYERFEQRRKIADEEAAVARHRSRALSAPGATG